MADCVFETGHTGAVLDVAVDASGRHLATASEDGTIRLYQCDAPNGPTGSSSSSGGGGNINSKTGAWRHVTTLGEAGGGEGPVCCVAWAPLAYYSAALVACTEREPQAALWRDVCSGSTPQYEKVYAAPLPSPGWCVAWAPQEYGKLFAVGCEDGTVVVMTGHDQTWETQSFTAHQSGCCGIAFAPFFPPGVLLMAPLQSSLPGRNLAAAPPLPIGPPRMVTCGSGRRVKVWSHSFDAPLAEGGGLPQSVWTSADLPTLVQATWRAVAWAPCVGLPFTYVAAGSEEGWVAVWYQDGPASDEWRCALLPQQLSAAVTRLSWSQVGTFLLVSCSDGTASMWKETSALKWEMASEMETPS